MEDVFKLVGINDWIQRVLGNPRHSWQSKYDVLFADHTHKKLLLEMHSAGDTESPLEEYLCKVAEEFNSYTMALTMTLSVEDVRRRVRFILEEYQSDSEGAHCDEDNLFVTLCMATAAGHKNAQELCSAALPLLKRYRVRWFA